MKARRVAFLDLAEQDVALRKELRAAVERVMASGRFVLGEEVEALEGELAAYTGSRYAIGCGSGTDALILALLALGVEAGDEILVPGFSFFATAGAAALIGARPVFADIDPITFHVDPDRAASRAARCERLRAVIPVHLYGSPVPRSTLDKLGATCRVPLLEDAAQALGARGQTGQPLGSESKIVCFSFYPTKNLGAAGEAGFIACDDRNIAERIRRSRNHGAGTDGRHRELGWNARLDALQAAILRVKLPHLERWNSARRANASDYSARLAAAGATPAATAQETGALPIILPHRETGAARATVHQYVVRVPSECRAELRAHLEADGIETAVYYPLGLHLQPCFASLGYRAGDLPETERAAGEVLSLPVHPSLRESDREYVVDRIVDFLKQRGRDAAPR